MKKSLYLFVSITVIFIVNLCFFSIVPMVSAETPANIRTHIVNEDSQFKNNKAVLVAGMWHNIEITMPSQKPRDLKIILFKGDEIPAVKNSTNYYEWSYEENRNEKWKDNIEHGGYSYINTNLCEKNRNVYSFCIGISDILPNDVFFTETWTLSIYENNQKVYSKDFFVEKATRGLAHSHGDNIYFYIDPFKKMTADGDDCFTLRNTGNVPLLISVEYNYFESYLEYNDFTEKISAGKKANYYLTINSDSWQPQRIERFGEINAKVSDTYIIDDNNAMVNLKSAFILDPPILNVFIGHSTYELFEDILDTGVSFQYKENFKMNEGEIRDINAYISGDGSVNLDIWTDDVYNIKILKIFNQGKEVNSPFYVFSSDDEELNITIRVEAIREGKTGDINYRFKSDNGKTKDFKTHIEIGPPIDIEPETTKEKSKLSFGSDTLLTGVVLLSVFAVIIYMFVSQIKHRRR